MARIIAPIIVFVILYLLIGYCLANKKLPVLRRTYSTDKTESMFYWIILAWPFVLVMLKVKNKVRKEGSSEWKNYR